MVNIILVSKEYRNSKLNVNGLFDKQKIFHGRHQTFLSNVFEAQISLFFSARVSPPQLPLA
jgi:hypothetical protein